MKLLIADDHFVVREGLKQIILKMNRDFQFDEAESGDEALRKISNSGYDLVIMDISMPGRSGLDILKMMNDRDMKIPVLILSIYPQEHYAMQALKLGASGYLCKDSLFEELNSAINAIASGKRYISPSLAERILIDSDPDHTLSPHQKLSSREFQIMCKLAKGMSLLEIANTLCISDKTVSTYRTRIMGKMRMTKNAELTIYAINNGLIEQ